MKDRRFLPVNFELMKKLTEVSKNIEHFDKATVEELSDIIYVINYVVGNFNDIAWILENRKKELEGEKYIDYQI